MDALKEIERLPLERVVEIHVSGYNEQEGVVWDDHAAPAPPLVFDLLERVAARARPKALTLEYNWLTFPPALLLSHIERSRDHPGAPVNARQVHAVLAAGVENPTLISRWRAEPARLLRLGIDPECLDLDALWKFSGLTIKVRHNGVRQQLPCTFRLMAAAGLEIGTVRRLRRLPQGVRATVCGDDHCSERTTSCSSSRTGSIRPCPSTCFSVTSPDTNTRCFCLNPLPAAGRPRRRRRRTRRRP